MADESQPARRPAARKKKKARKTSGGARAMADATAVERPVKTVERPRTTKYIVTVDNVTGLILKVDPFAEGTTKRQAERTAKVEPASMAETVATPPEDPTGIGQAYYRGIADYYNTLMTIK